MKKEEFLETLEIKLGSLKESEKAKIIKKYKTTITKRLNKKEKEEKIIASFGNIDELAEQILKESGFTLDNSKSNFINRFIDIIKNLIDFISEQEFKVILKIILEIAAVILFIAILKLPVILIRDILLNFLDVMGVGYSSLISIIIFRVIDIIYLILALILFINIFNKRFNKYRKQKI